MQKSRSQEFPGTEHHKRPKLQTGVQHTHQAFCFGGGHTGALLIHHLVIRQLLVCYGGGSQRRHEAGTALSLWKVPWCG